MYSLEVSLSFSIFGLISQSLCIVSNVLPIGSSHYRVFTFPERIQQKLQHKTLHRSHHRGTLLPSVCVFGCQIDIKLYTLLSLQCLFLFFFCLPAMSEGAWHGKSCLFTAGNNCCWNAFHFGALWRMHLKSKSKPGHFTCGSPFCIYGWLLFCFVFLCKLLFFKEVEGYKSFMLDGCAQVTLNGIHILRLSRLFSLYIPS